MKSAMSDSRRILICSCDGTVPLGTEAIRCGCHSEPITATQLCRAELDRFRSIALQDGPLTVACTQEAVLFSDIAAQAGRVDSIQFANIRETAGWSGEGAQAGPKMAALLAAAAEPAPDAPFVKLESGGVILICGRDETAVEAGKLLKDHLDVTVLIEPPAAVVPPRVNDFPVAKGKVRTAKGHLGAFEITVDDFAEPIPSSRGTLEFGPSRHNARSNCDIVLDLTGGTAFFPASDLRDAICARIPAVLPQCCKRFSRHAISSARSTSRAISPSMRRYAPTRAPV
jgi:hypothetical protein